MAYGSSRKSAGTLSASVLLPTVLSFIFSFLLVPALPLDDRTGTPTSNDLQTLLCLRSHLSDDPAGSLTSWKNNSLGFCAWAGVSCSKSQRVVALNLDSFGLTGQIPACSANLAFLERIHFPNNHLTGPIPHELGQLPRLQYLNLSSNYLGGDPGHTVFMFSSSDRRSWKKFSPR